MHVLKTVNIVSACCAALALHAAENWPGYEGGHLHHNASAMEIDPNLLRPVWQRSFDHPVPAAGRASNGGGFHASRNLVIMDDYLAIIAADCPDATGILAYVTIVETAQSGTTVNCIQTMQTRGALDLSRGTYPTGFWANASDTGVGISCAHWDAGTGILFLKSGGDGPGSTAYLPLANTGTYVNGTWQHGYPGYTNLVAQNPGFQDAVGLTRSLLTYKFLNHPVTNLSPEHWHYGGGVNQTSFFECDDTTPLMISCPQKNHIQAGSYYVVNKFSGMQALPGNPPIVPVINDPPYANPPNKLSSFARWGGTLVNSNRIFFMGPGDDNDASASLGNAAGLGYEEHSVLDYPDQGLYLWASDATWSDVRPNDGCQTPATNETVSLTAAFKYRFVTPHIPTNGPGDCESYLETDGMYRNKAWLVDGMGVWAAWKPTQTGNVELIHADDTGARRYDLGVCAGMRGQDIWPHISLAQPDSAKYIVYYAGNAENRDYIYTNRPYIARGAWSPTLSPPLGDAQMAVFNCTATNLMWTYNLSQHYPSLPTNDFWMYLDTSISVTAGKYAYVGWLDLSAPTAALRLVSFDITASSPAPVDVVVPLGFTSGANRKSQLWDLIACNGRLYALVTQSDELRPDWYRWSAQHVVALGIPEPGAITGAFVTAALLLRRR